MTIRVTPIGGEPVELPEEKCVPTSPPFGKFIGFAYGIVEMECYDGTAYTREPASSVICDNGWKDAFVCIGDTWPLCEVETWRERAERLEGELETLYAAMKRQPCLATIRFMPDCRCIPCVARREAGEPEDKCEDSEAAMGWYCSECKDQPPDGCPACR